MEGISLPEGYSYEEKKLKCEKKKLGGTDTDYIFLYKRGIPILSIPAKYCSTERIMEVARQTADF